VLDIPQGEGIAPIQIPFEKFSDLSAVLSKLVATGRISTAELPGYARKKIGASSGSSQDEKSSSWDIRPQTTLVPKIFSPIQQFLPDSLVNSIQKAILMAASNATQAHALESNSFKVPPPPKTETDI
jgi:hypothetical protein